MTADTGKPVGGYPAIRSGFEKRGPRLKAAFGCFAPVAVLVALLAALGSFAPSFLSFYSLSVLAGELSVILLLATGQTIVILLGGIDLSMAALASLASVLIALSVPKAGAAGLLAVLALTTGIGAIQGFVHARAQIASFVVTLAGLGLWSGAALTIAHTTIPVSLGYEVVGWLNGYSSSRRRSAGSLLAATSMRSAWARSPLSSRAYGSRA